MTEHLTPKFGLPYYEGGDPADGAGQQRALAEKLDTVLEPLDARVTLPIGALMMWLAPALPSDRWLLCNGATPDLSAYPTLGSLLGEGPAGKFTLPDLRTRLPIGAGTGYPLREAGGAATVTLDASQIPAHTHNPGSLSPAAAGAHSHGGATAGAGPYAHSARAPYGLFSTAAGNQPGLTTIQFADWRFLVVDETPVHAHGISVDGAHGHSMNGATAANTGGGGAHPNIPPYVAINFIILAK